MYNRYIPQPDGSYRRSRIQDTPPPPPKPEPRHPVTDTVPPVIPSRQPNERSQPRPIPPRPRKNMEPAGIGQFLRQLLPKDFDTEDLLIVLLLLLMSGDCQEDQNTALLTLVLYLFL